MVVDLLSGRLCPVVEYILTLGFVIMLVVLEADSTDRDGLDNSASGKEVEDLPHQLRRPEQVAGERLAAELCSLAHSCLVGKLEERNIAEVQRRQVRQDGIGQRELLSIGVCGQALARRGNARLIGGYNT